MPWNGSTPQDPSFVREYTPQKAYTKSTVHSLQNVDPYDFSGGRNREIRDAAELTRGGLLGGLLSGFLSLGQLLNDLATALSGGGAFGPGPLRDIRDGQLDLNNNVELLSPLLDYGSCYMATKFNFGGSSVRVRFLDQIGPMRGCHLDDGRIVLDDKGLWDIRCQLKYDISLANGICGLEVQVLRPDMSVYSTQEGLNYATGQATITVVTSVVVPDPGYRVQVIVVQTTQGRGIEGGPKANRLTVQHLSRRTDIGNTGQE